MIGPISGFDVSAFNSSSDLIVAASDRIDAPNSPVLSHLSLWKKAVSADEKPLSLFRSSHAVFLVLAAALLVVPQSAYAQNAHCGGPNNPYPLPGGFPTLMAACGYELKVVSTYPNIVSVTFDGLGPETQYGFTGWARACYFTSTNNTGFVNTDHSPITCDCTIAGGVRDGADSCRCPVDPSSGQRLFWTGKACVPSNPGYAGGPSCPNCGNPVNPAIGNKYESVPLYAGNGPFPLSVTLFYNSMGDNRYGSIPFSIGEKWRHTYQARVHFNALTAGGYVAYVLRPDGKVFDFNATSISGPYAPAAIHFLDRLERLTDSGGAFQGWRYTSSDGDINEIYDTNGLLVSLTNRAGLSITLAYVDEPLGSVTGIVPEKLLNTVTDPFGRSLTFAYDSNRRVATMRDPANGVYAFTYDSSDNLTSITFPDNRVRTYLYNELANTFSGSDLYNHLTGITDENGQRFATFKYAQFFGRAISSEHAGGAGKVTLTYADVNAPATVTDAFNNARPYGYTVLQGLPLNGSITGPVCPSCGPASATYDANGFVASRKDWNGNLTCYTNDARGLETRRVEGLSDSGTCAAPVTTPATRTITTEWHSTWRLPARIAEPLRITTYVYHGDNGVSCGAAGALCSKAVQASSDATGASGFAATPSGAARTWSYTYNANGQLLTVDGPRTDVADVTSYSYYANNDPDPAKRANVATIANALGHLTQITSYDAHGKPLSIVDPNGLVTTLSYDTRQRLVSRDVGGEITGYTYDAVGQLTRVTLPDGSFLDYSYDAAHRLTGMSDNLGNRIAYTLDAMGNRTAEQVFDPASQLAQTRSRVYSNLNRLAQEIGAQNQTTAYGYDNQGNVTSITDPLTRVTGNQYDALNRLIRVTDPNLGQTQYGYSGIDQLTSVTDPRNLATTYGYDGLGNLNQQVSPDTGTTQNTYDAAGNLLTQTDAKGQVTTYTYDALNRVASISFHDGSRQTYTYDQGANGIGRLAAITESDPQNQLTSQIAYGYDQKGRVVTETRTIAGVSYASAYSYDSFGRLSGITYPSGRTLVYGFDALGRINQVTTTQGSDTQVVVSNVAYQPFGGVQSYTLGNGQSYTRAYDLDGRIASYTLGGSQFNLGFDAASRVSFLAENANPANTNSYGYDGLDRLTQALLPANSFGYSYDAVGNRLTKNTGANTDLYAYSTSSNRLASITPASGPLRTFQFDANGSTINDAANQYAYDARGRLIQATTAQGSTGYQVNALGQRIRKSDANGEMVFHYDARGRLIAEGTASGAFKREYLYLNDIPIAVVVVP